MATNKELATIVGDELAQMLSALRINDMQELKRRLRTSLQVEVADLWGKPEFARTHWILLINSVDDTMELELSSALLNWKHLTVKDSARLACIQTSDRQQFKFACSRFGISECPALVMSDSPLMEEFLKIDGELLLSLAQHKGGLLRFVNKLHTMIENGAPLAEVGQKLNQDQFWKGLKLVYKEVKSLFSISVSA
jgi:hypothetical protein